MCCLGNTSLADRVATTDGRIWRHTQRCTTMIHALGLRAACLKRRHAKVRQVNTAHSIVIEDIFYNNRVPIPHHIITLYMRRHLKPSAVLQPLHHSANLPDSLRLCAHLQTEHSEWLLLPSMAWHTSGWRHVDSRMCDLETVSVQGPKSNVCTWGCDGRAAGLPRKELILWQRGIMRQVTRWARKTGTFQSEIVSLSQIIRW